MVVIEIAQNTNCEPVDLRVFHDLEPARWVHQVYLERQPGQPAWYEVTGWTAESTPCQAVAQRVDDSGDGVALLIRGGEAGLRLRRADNARPWQLGDSEQWGEPFLIIPGGEWVR